MTDIKLIEDQIKGLQAENKELRAYEKLFLKAAGLEEQKAKAQEVIEALETDIEISRERLGDLRGQKNDAIRPSLLAIQDKMNEVLPEGDGIIHIEDDGSVTIGWLKDCLRPYAGLSGGEKVVCNGALSYALLGNAENKVIIFEGAELDQGNLRKYLLQIDKNPPDAQVIINTCHAIFDCDLSDEWNIIKIEGENSNEPGSVSENSG